MLTSLHIFPHTPALLPFLHDPDYEQLRPILRGILTSVAAIQQEKPSTILMISALGPLLHHRVLTPEATSYTTGLKLFHEEAKEYTLPADATLTKDLIENLINSRIPVESIQNQQSKQYELDPASSIAMYFFASLTQEISLASIYPSDHAYKTQGEIGEAIGSIVSASKQSVSIVVIAEGSQSQENTELAKLIEAMLTNPKESMKSIPRLTELADIADERNLRALMIALGIISSQDLKESHLATSSPFGAQYISACYK